LSKGTLEEEEEGRRKLDHPFLVADLIHVAANQRTSVREDSSLDLGATWSKGLFIGLGNFVKGKKL